jgi:hypothetical protein
MIVPLASTEKEDKRKILAGIREKGLLGVADISCPDLTQTANHSSPGGEQWKT